MLPNANLIAVADAFLGTIMTPEVNPMQIDDSGSVGTTENESHPPNSHSEQDILVAGRYSDATEKLKALQSIAKDAPE